MAVQGTVTRVFSGGADVQVGNQTLRATLRRRLLAGRRTAKHVLAPGDLVVVDPIGGDRGEATIEERLPRRNSIARAAAGGRYVQVLYANVDLLVVVGSVRAPPLRPGLFDRFIVAAEREGIRVLLLANKADLGVPGAVQEVMQVYRAIGYDMLATSAVSGLGMVELREQLSTAQLSVFAGHSGVGKSSVLNRLYPGFQQKTREVSRQGRGRHVTTQTLLLPLEDGSCVADTPGVRSFALHDMLPEEAGFLFREIAPLIPRCRFRGCLHVQEPSCAVLEALERGEIHRMRYESYLRILQSLGAAEPVAEEDPLAPEP